MKILLKRNDGLFPPSVSDELNVAFDGISKKIESFDPGETFPTFSTSTIDIVSDYTINNFSFSIEKEHHILFSIQPKTTIAKFTPIAKIPAFDVSNVFGACCTDEKFIPAVIRGEYILSSEELSPGTEYVFKFDFIGA